MNENKSGNPPRWSPEQLDTVKKILRKYPPGKYATALTEISQALGRELTADAVGSVFRRQGMPPPSSFCNASSAPPVKKEVEDIGQFRGLLALMRRGPIDFSDLCDRLDLSPRRTGELIDAAKNAGIQVHIEHGHVGIRPSGPEDKVRTIGIAPTVGERQRVAVISDTHLGSKYCLRDPLKDFIHYAYEQGVREVLHPGDVLDGMYRHGIYEVSHVGLDEQASDLLETLPQLPGLNYRCITGNHDFTFTATGGMDVGHYLSNYFRRNGRDDLHFYGNRGAFLRVKGAVVHLWHPTGGLSYSRSYKLQKQIETYSSGEKPNILLAGHWHQYCHVYERGVHAFLCPTFQGGGSAFAKSIGGAPAIGGMILSWDLTEHGTMRSFIHEYRAYFEVEKPHRIDDDTAYLPEMDKIPVRRR